MSMLSLLADISSSLDSSQNNLMGLFEKANNWVLTSHDGKTLWVLCMAQITTVLVVYSPEIERAMRRALKKYNFFVRTTGFILLHAIGYGLTTVFLATVLAQVYPIIPSPFVPVVMTGIFLAIGLLAQKHKHI